MSKVKLLLRVKVTGTVIKVDGANPHVWFYVDVKDEAATVTN